jgi:hypothetical protein
VGPRAGLDAMQKRENFPFRDSNPGRPAPSPSLYRHSGRLVTYLIHDSISVLFFAADVCDRPNQPATNAILGTQFEYHGLDTYCAGTAL